MSQAELTVEREASRRKPPSNAFQPGNPGGGRPKGTPNKVTKTIREAVLEAVKPGACHPEGLTGWLIDRANGGIEDRKIFAGIVSRVIPVEITGEGGGAIKVELGWLSGRKVANDVIDITPATQMLGEQATARVETDLLSESTVIVSAVGAGEQAQTASLMATEPSRQTAERELE